MAAHRSTGGVFLDARSVYAPSASKLVPCLIRSGDQGKPGEPVHRNIGSV